MMNVTRSNLVPGPNRLVMSVLVLGVLISTAAQGQLVCDVPLFVKTTTERANVMILADDSGSMGSAVYHSDYDVNASYTGPFGAGSEKRFYVNADGMYEAADFDSDLADSTKIGPFAPLVRDKNGNGYYEGNYMNWIFYHATDAQRASLPQVTRIAVLREVLAETITRSNSLQFGLATFNGDDGAIIEAKCGADNAFLLNRIESLTAGGWTPLGESMEDILDYFAGGSSPITASCQYNFIIVVTDGLPTQDLNVSPYLWDADGDGKDPNEDCDGFGSDCSDHFDDVAYWLAHHDINSDQDGDQHAYSYVVGFGLDAPILQDAADNGKGLYFSANNANELTLSLDFALTDVMRRISSGSAVAVVSTERGTDDRLYRGKFMPSDWFGFLEAFALPYTKGDTPVWDAGQILSDRDPDDRAIFTAIGSTEYNFVPARADFLYTHMGMTDIDEAAEVIAWGRGNNVNGMRDHMGWMLGDIIHSTPVVVGPPSGFTATPEYQTFYEANANRQKMVYVGANDGMLHAFNADTGREEWAFVPEFTLPVFEAMADTGYCHLYTCDQTATVKDVMLNGVWRTILISGGRQGGSAIFALDVTNPYAPSVLWQNYLPNGQVFNSDVVIANIGHEAVALVGSGLDYTLGEAWLYAFEVDSGYLLSPIRLSASPGDRNKATAPVAVDVDLDGQTDLVYIADLLGTVYRFKTGGLLSPGVWSYSRLYTGNQPITATPVAAFGLNGGINLYFGTGAYLDDDDLNDFNQQSFLCVYDQHSGTAFTKNDLTDQTTGITDASGYAGWYVDLWAASGERVNEKAVVVAETVVFTTNAPTMEACKAGGTSYIYQMNYQSGATSDDEESDKTSGRMVALGDGLASHPVVDLAQGTAVVQSSNASIQVTPINAPIIQMVIRSWQEDFSAAMNQ